MFQDLCKLRYLMLSNVRAYTASCNLFSIIWTVISFSANTLLLRHLWALIFISCKSSISIFQYVRYINQTRWAACYKLCIFYLSESYSLPLDLWIYQIMYPSSIYNSFCCKIETCDYIIYLEYPNFYMITRSVICLPYQMFSWTVQTISKSNNVLMKCIWLTRQQWM